MKNGYRIGLLALALGAAGLAPGALHAQDASAAREGITIHGAWTIEVLDPDGTLVERRAFTNAFVAPGTLAAGLAGQKTLVVSGINVDVECDGPGTGGGAVLACIIPTTATVPATGADANALVLEGSAVAQPASGTTGQITEVATTAFPCNPGTTTTTCLNDLTLPLGELPVAFTRTTLDTPVDVADGQTVVVRVVISFN